MKKTLFLGVTVILLNGCNGSSVTAPENGNTKQSVDSVRVISLITQKCTICHSQNPSMGNGQAGGIMFDTESQIKARAGQIKQEVIVEGKMPKRPVTITEEEKALIGLWVEQQ